MNTFAKLVSEKMEQQRISIRKLAKEAGLDPSFLSKVLTGKRSPPWDEKILKKIAKILGLDPLRLIVSCGRIPYELQPLMEKPEVIKSLLGISYPLSGSAPSLPPASSLIKESRKRNEIPKKVLPTRKKEKAFSLPPGSVPLSEDLL